MVKSSSVILLVNILIKRYIWIIVVAIALRTGINAILQPELQSDAADYHRLGVCLAEGKGYIQDGNPTAYRPVGYPLFIGIVYFLSAPDPRIVRWVQVFISAFSVILLGMTAYRFGGDRSAKRAVWVGCLYVPDLLYPAVLLSETLFTALQWGMILGVSRFFVEEDSIPERRLSSAIATGLAAGYAGLVKAFAVVLLPAALFRSPRRLFNTYIFTVLAVTLLVVSIWMVRNALVMGIPVITTNSGANLWVGNNPQATGGYKWVQPKVKMPSEEVESGAALRKLALNAIADEPLKSLGRIILKWAHLFRSEGELLIAVFSLDSKGGYAAAYRQVPWWISLVTFLCYGTAVISGWTGWFFGKRGEWRKLVSVLFLTYMIIAAVYFGSSRFHSPMIPLFLLSASLAEGWKTRMSSAGWMVKFAWRMGVFFFIGVWTLEGWILFTEGI